MTVLVKLCGLMHEADVDAALDAGADAIGLVLCPSPRMVRPDDARRLAARARGRAAVVGVLRAYGPDEARLCEGLSLDAIEAEGAPAAPLPPGAFFLPVVRDGVHLVAHVEQAPAPAHRAGSFEGLVLIDGPSGGGLGLRADVARAALAASKRPVCLAGGLSPDTVGEAIAAVRPAAVDVSSGIERSRGVKCHSLMRSFVAEARAASARLSLTRSPA